MKCKSAKWWNLDIKTSSPDTQSLKYRCQGVSITAENDFVLATSTLSQVPVPVPAVQVPVQVQVLVMQSTSTSTSTRKLYLSTDQVPVPVPSTTRLVYMTFMSMVYAI